MPPRRRGGQSIAAPPDEGTLHRRVSELEAVFGALGDGVLVVDTAGRIVEANPAMLELLGLRSKGEILGPLGQTLLGRVTGLAGAPLRPEDVAGHRVLRRGQRARVDLLLPARQAAPVIVEALASPIYEPDGAILGAVIACRDVTEQRRRERHAELAGAVEDAIASRPVHDALGLLADRFVGALGDWCAAYLLDANDDFLRVAVLRHRDPRVAENLADALARRPLRRGEGLIGAAMRAERTVVLPDLTDRLVGRHARDAREAQLVGRLGLRAVIVAPLRGERGVLGALSLGWAAPAPGRPDDADRRLAEGLARRIGAAVERERRVETLGRALGRLDVVLDAMPDGLIVFGGDGRAVLANASARRILDLGMETVGWSLDDIARLTAAFLDGPVRADELVARLREESEGVIRIEVRLVRPRPRDLEWMVAPVRAPDGEPIGRLLLVRDLTRIRDAERARDEAVSSLGRELRMPLTAMSAYATQALRRARRTGDRSIVHGLEVILRNSRQLSVLVGDLLDAARVEVDGIALELEDVDVLALVHQAMDQARALTTLHRLRLDAPTTVAPARWDPDRIRQALVNVLANAVKFCPMGGQIGVRVRVHSDGAVISVRDRGVGIPPEQLERVFDRFYRVPDRDGRPRVPGPGLGLHLVRAIAQAHGGAAWAESTGVPDEGTTVHLILPWRADPA
jgi:signal transduction histidine kinase